MIWSSLIDTPYKVVFKKYIFHCWPLWPGKYISSSPTATTTSLWMTWHWLLGHTDVPALISKMENICPHVFHDKTKFYPLHLFVCLEWNVQMFSSFSLIWGFWKCLHLEEKTQNETCLRVLVISCYAGKIISGLTLDNSHGSAVRGWGCVFSTSFPSWRLPSLRREATTATRCSTWNYMITI